MRDEAKAVEPVEVTRLVAKRLNADDAAGVAALGVRGAPRGGGQAAAGLRPEGPAKRGVPISASNTGQAGGVGRR
jgi:hypothetical protein